MPEAQQTDEQAEEDRREAHELAATRVKVIHAAVTEEGEGELRRSNGALAFSALAAGMSMSFSCLAVAMVQSRLPHEHWAELISQMGYGVGFLIVILGRQQLFTENTLTVILPLMKRRDAATLFQVARVWLIVLGGNVVGGTIVAWALAHTTAIAADVQAALAQIGHDAAEPSFLTLLLRGVFAGWLIALLVWLLPAAESGRVWVILLITYLVALGNFAHIVVGTIETSYAAFTGRIDYADVVGKFFPAALLGNIIGGVTLTSAVNHGQVVADE